MSQVIPSHLAWAAHKVDEQATKQRAHFESCRSTVVVGIRIEDACPSMDRCRARHLEDGGGSKGQPHPNFLSGARKFKLLPLPSERALLCISLETCRFQRSHYNIRLSSDGNRAAGW